MFGQATVSSRPRARMKLKKNCLRRENHKKKIQFWRLFTSHKKHKKKSSWFDLNVFHYAFRSPAATYLNVQFWGFAPWINSVLWFISIPEKRDAKNAFVIFLELAISLAESLTLDHCMGKFMMTLLKFIYIAV